MMYNFNNIFFFEPSKKHSAMPPDYKLELDTTESCTDTEKSQYCQYNGEKKWAAALVRIDIMYTTVVLLQYPPVPCKGQLSKIQHIYGYLKKYTSTSIKFNTETPDYENFKTIEGNWGNFYAG